IRLSWIWKLSEKSPSGSNSGVTIWLRPFVVAKEDGTFGEIPNIIVIIRTTASRPFFFFVFTGYRPTKTVRFEFVDSVLYTSQSILRLRIHARFSHRRLSA